MNTYSLSQHDTGTKQYISLHWTLPTMSFSTHTLTRYKSLQHGTYYPYHRRLASLRATIQTGIQNTTEEVPQRRAVALLYTPLPTLPSLQQDNPPMPTGRYTRYSYHIYITDVFTTSGKGYFRSMHFIEYFYITDLFSFSMSWIYIYKSGYN